MKPVPTKIVRRDVDGVLLLDKPSGMTSNAALQKARWLLRANKAGHTGTLDPLASGLLPLCFGEATRFAQRLLDARKGYLATIRFGVTTDTGDADGAVTGTHAVTFSRAELEEALTRFVGEQWQVPPMYSALKVEGQPLYRLARAGETVEREPRPITVHGLSLVGGEAPEVQVAVDCSKGTYVRVLAEDLGAALGCGAHLTGLRRTCTGGFDVADAVTLDALAAMDEPARIALLRPAALLLAGMPVLALDPDAARRFAHGQAVPAGDRQDGEYAVFAGEQLLGLAAVGDGLARPARVLPSAQGATPAVAPPAEGAGR